MTKKTIINSFLNKNYLICPLYPWDFFYTGEVTLANKYYFLKESFFYRHFDERHTASHKWTKEKTNCHLRQKCLHVAELFK